MALPPLTAKVIHDLGAAMQAAADRCEQQAARIAELERCVAEVVPLLTGWEQTVAAVEQLSDAQVRWFQNSGPFRHICKAEMARRKL